MCALVTELDMNCIHLWNGLEWLGLGGKTVTPFQDPTQPIESKKFGPITDPKHATVLNSRINPTHRQL